MPWKLSTDLSTDLRIRESVDRFASSQKKLSTDSTTHSQSEKLSTDSTTHSREGIQVVVITGPHKREQFPVQAPARNHPDDQPAFPALDRNDSNLMVPARDNEGNLKGIGF